MLRYAILHHTGVPEPHFDLMFETYPGSDLATWRSSAWPIERPTPLTRLRDHRRIYLDFEGELTNRRGIVQRVAGGTCTVQIEEATRWVIRLLTGQEPDALEIWRLDGEVWTARPRPDST